MCDFISDIEEGCQKVLYVFCCCLIVGPVLVVVGIVYWLLSVFSPETARKMKDALKGDSL